MHSTWTGFPWGYFVLFGTLVKKNAEFCMASNDDAGVGGHATANEVRADANVSTKRRDTFEGSTCGAIDRALDCAIFLDHNYLLVAKMMKKYRDAEDKAKAMSMLRDFSDRGKENKAADSTPTETLPIPFIHDPLS
jgi:hypothetical protein